MLGLKPVSNSEGATCTRVGIKKLRLPQEWFPGKSKERLTIAKRLALRFCRYLFLDVNTGSKLSRGML